jgi:hypothetical protein
MPSTRLLLMLCLAVTARCALPLGDTKPSTTPPTNNPDADVHIEMPVLDHDYEEDLTPNQLIQEADSAAGEGLHDDENAAPDDTKVTPPPLATNPTNKKLSSVPDTDKR